MITPNEGPTMQPAFTRSFRLHHNGRIIHGAEFPTGHVLVADDPEYGLASAATSLDELLKGYHGARVEWAPAADRAVEIEQLRAEVERLHAGEEPGSTPHGNLTDGQWLRLFNEAGPAQRLAVINCLRWEAARGADCFLMDHAGRLDREQRARVAPEQTAPADRAAALPEREDVHGIQFPTGIVLYDHPGIGLEAATSTDNIRDLADNATIHWADEENPDGR